MTAPPAAPAKAAPAAPGFTELFEQSLIAVAGPSVFRRAAARPAASFGVSASFALACGAGAAAIAVAHFVVAGQGASLPFSPAVLAAAGVAVAGLYASLLLLLSVLLYAAGGALGKKGEFERGMQAAAVLSVWVPVQALCGWFPYAWFAPALLAAWVAAGALEGLFDANPGGARALALFAAAAAIGVQYLGREFVDRTYDAYVMTQTISSAQAAGLAAMQQAAAAVPPAPAVAPAAAPAAPAQASTSGLDLLRGGLSDDGDAPPAAPAAAPTQAQTAEASVAQAAAAAANDPAAQALSQSAAGMIDALGPMLNVLTASKNLKPEQKADIRQLQGMMQELKADMASGRKLDNAVFNEKMRRYQALLMKVMASAPAPSSGGPAGPPSAVRLQVPQDSK